MITSDFGKTVFRTPSDGVAYASNRWGGLSQINPLPFYYTETYNATYDTEAYKQAEARLMAMRMGLVLSYCPKPISLLDFGYGNGAFLDKASEHCLVCYGHDVALTNYHQGKRWQRVESWQGLEPEAVCFWDSLEHLEHPLQTVRDIGAMHVFISLPWAHLEEWEVEDFDTWKHRKPDEHLHHFSGRAIRRFAKEAGYRVEWLGCLEDEVRTPARPEKNILTAVLVHSF